MDDVLIKNKKERCPITVWVDEDDKALYDILRDEYDVECQKEMKKVILDRLEYLKKTLIKDLAG